MKNIKELELLVNFARSLGQTPDPEMIEQIREHYEFQKKIVESVKANSAKDLNTAFGQEIIKETTNELVQTPPRKKVSTEEILSDTSSSGESIPEQSLAARAAKLITEAPKKDSYQQPDIPLTDSSMKAVQDKLKFLEQWLGKVSMTGPGGGAVNLKDLDDVSKYSIQNATEHQYLTYNAQSKLWIATNHTNTNILLDDLADVVLTAPQNGQVLKYDTTSNAWVNAADFVGNTSNSIALTDLAVSISGSANVGGNLSYNSTTGVFTYRPAFQDRLINGSAVVIMDSTNNFSNLGNLVPLTPNLYTLGTPTNKWQELYVGPGSVYIEDTVTHQNANLTITNGVLLVNGVYQLQVGQLKFANNNIESTTGNIDIQIGLLNANANIVLNRNIVIGQGKSIKFADNTIQTTAYTTGVLTTANVKESSSNLYFTNTRVVSALSTDSTLTLNANGQIASNTTPVQLMAYGQFWDTTTQVCNANTATLMRFNRQDGHQGLSLANANTRVILQNTGTYNLQFSSQFVNTTNSPEPTWIWFRQANVDLTDSAGLVSVPKKDGAVDGSIVVSWNTLVTTTIPNDYVELVWFTVDQTNNQMTYYANASAVAGVSPAIPAIPSVILTVEQIR